MDKKQAYTKQRREKGTRGTEEKLEALIKEVTALHEAQMHLISAVTAAASDASTNGSEAPVKGANAVNAFGGHAKAKRLKMMNK